MKRMDNPIRCLCFEQLPVLTLLILLSLAALTSSTRSELAVNGLTQREYFELSPSWIVNRVRQDASYIEPRHKQIRGSYQGIARHSIAGRDTAPQCGPGKPCVDGSCCNKDSKCGYKSANCGSDCISNCNAKAMCGVDSPGGNVSCGLHTCCSYYGYCGVSLWITFRSAIRTNYLTPSRPMLFTAWIPSRSTMSLLVRQTMDLVRSSSQKLVEVAQHLAEK